MPRKKAAPKPLVLNEIQTRALTKYWAEWHAAARSNRFVRVRRARRAYAVLNDMLIVIGGPGATLDMTPAGPVVTPA